MTNSSFSYVNGDNRLTEDEFTATSDLNGVDKQFREAERRYQEERRKEFHEMIDTNRDGFASSDELYQYMNPRNPMHAKQEARELMQMADVNNDGFVTKEEMLAQKEHLAASNMLQPVRRLHDDL